jgi:hypothetical protein
MNANIPIANDALKMSLKNAEKQNENSHGLTILEEKELNLIATQINGAIFNGRQFIRIDYIILPKVYDYLIKKQYDVIYNRYGIITISWEPRV